MSNSVRSAASSSPTTQIPSSRSRASVAGSPRNEGDRHVLDGAGRRLGDGRRDVHGPVAREEHPVDAGAVAVADDRPEVARIGDAVDGDQERRAPGTPLDEVGELGLRQRRGEGDDALRRLAARLGVELRPSDVGDRHPVGMGQGDDVGDAVVGRAVVTDQLRRDPHLVDLAPSGDQQLADGLASLDLLAAETLGSPLAGWGSPASRLIGPVRPAPRVRGAGLRGAAARRPGVVRAPVCLAGWARLAPVRPPPARPAGDRPPTVDPRIVRASARPAPAPARRTSCRATRPSRCPPPLRRAAPCAHSTRSPCTRDEHGDGEAGDALAAARGHRGPPGDDP